MSENVIDDLYLALTGRKPHFDGNAQKSIKSWQWVYESRLDDEDYQLLLEHPSLDWVIVLVPE